MTTYEVMEFEKNTFRRGRNLTVRRGTKWSSHKFAFVDGQLVALETYVTTFDKVSEKALWCEQDETCRTKQGLLSALNQAYRKFSKNEDITLVYFEK